MDPRVERDQKVCALYQSGEPINDIAEKCSISVSTIYVIIKRYDIPLRTDQKQVQSNKAVYIICDYFDKGVSIEYIAKILNTDVRKIVLVLKNYRTDQLERYFRRIKIQEAIEKKKRELDELEAKRDVPDGSYLGEKLTESERDRLGKNYPDMAGNFNHYLDRALLGQVGKTKKEHTDTDIAREYTSGKDLSEILEKFSISSEYLFYLVEADSNYPGYFPDRPPLDV